MTSARWTVEARENAAEKWTAWSEWVDRATAESEKANAIDEGYQARIVAAAERELTDEDIAEEKLRSRDYEAWANL